MKTIFALVALLLTTQAAFASPYPAIEAYTAGSYEATHHEESEKADKFRAQLSQELASLPAAPGVVWHGGCVSQEELDAFQVGRSKTFRFLSTTRVAAIASNYANVRYGQAGLSCHPIILKLNQVSGRDIQEFSVFPAEQETLLGAAAEFEVIARPSVDNLPAEASDWLRKAKRLDAYSYIELSEIGR